MSILIMHQQKKLFVNEQLSKIHSNNTGKIVSVLMENKKFLINKLNSKTIVFSINQSHSSNIKSKNMLFNKAKADFVNPIKKTQTALKSKQISQKLFISFQNTTKLPIYTSYSKMDEVKLVTIGLASANRIRQWAEKTLPNGKVVGEVTNANTLHHKTFKPQKGGLFCERIFGPLKDFECACGSGKKAKQLVLPRASQALPFMNKKEKETKLQDTSAADQLIQQQEKLGSNFEKNTILSHTTSFGQMNNYKRFFCSKCDVEYTWSVIRRYQLGYIKLNAPVTHVWYVKGNPSYISLLLDMKKKHLEYVTYCAETLTLENSLKASATADDFTIGSELPKDLYALWEKASALSTKTDKKNPNPNNTIVIENAAQGELNNNSNLSKKNWYFFNSLESSSTTFSTKPSTIFSGNTKTLFTKQVNKNIILKAKKNQSFLHLLSLTINDEELNIFKNKSILNKLNVFYNTRTRILQKHSWKNNNVFTNASGDDSIKTRFEKTLLNVGISSLELPQILALKTNKQTDLNFIDANALVTKYENFFMSCRKNKKQNNLLTNNKKSLNSNSKDIEKSLGVSILKNKQYLNKAFCSTRKVTPNISFTLLPLNNELLNPSITNSKVLNAFSKIYIRSSFKQNTYNFVSTNSTQNLKNNNNTVLSGLENIFKLNYVASNKEVALRFNSLLSQVIASFNFVTSSIEKSSDSKLLAYLISLLDKRRTMLYSFNNIELIIHKKMNKVKNILLKAIKLNFKKISIESKKNKKMNNQRVVNINGLFLLKLISFSKMNNRISLINLGQNELRLLSFVPFTLNSNPLMHTNKYLISIATVMKLVRSIYLQNSFQTTKSLVQEQSKITLNKKIQLNTSILKSLKTVNDSSVALEELIRQTLITNITQSNLSTVEKSFKSFKKIQKTVVNVLVLNRIFIFLKKFNLLKSGNISLFRSPINSKTIKKLISFSKENKNFLTFTKEKSFLINGSVVSLFLNNSEQVKNTKVQKYFDKKYFLEFQKSLSLKHLVAVYSNDSQVFHKNIDLSKLKKAALLKKQFVLEIPLTNKVKLIKLAYSLSQTSRTKSTTEVNFYSNSNKFIVNNIYCLSHRELWDQEKDWYFFAFYFFTAPDLDDISVPVYEYRNYDFSLLNTFFSKEPSTAFSKTLMSPNSNSINHLSSNINETKFEKNSPFLEEKPNLHIAYSGAGMIQALLAEFDYFELKKMDKQNRILLYDLNKYLKKLKKSLSLYSMAAGKLRLGNLKSIGQTKEFKDSKTDTSLFNKNYALIKKEFKEVCKQRDSLIRRTKFIRKVFRNYTGFSRSTSVDLYSNTQTTVQKAAELNSQNSTSLDVGMNRLTSMVLTLLPVLPPDLRPIVKMGSQIAASDLNRLYQRVIYRNDRLKKFLKDPTTNGSFEMKYAQRLLQEAVDNLIQNGKSGVVPEKDARGRALKSLSDLLKGKQGRFRQYLLGKRVDYSGRSVIVVGPKLKLHECGIPKEMALELYLPFLIKRILTQNLARTVIGAKALIQNNKPLAWSLLREIMKTCPVLLNRAPTLHRLGFQAFQPKLVDGRAILLHPLVCPAFNADFDGDQMAVHVPITVEARTEAWKLMLARNNLLSPATGEPLVLPSQDMVLGCYYLTNNGNLRTQKFEKGYGMYFDSFNEVLRAYYQGVVSTHAMVWVKWEGYFENPNADHLEQPIEIRINKYGVTYMIYPKHHSIYNKQNQLVKRMIRTTPGKILFNSLILKSLS